MIISQKKTAEEIHHYSRCRAKVLLIFSGTLILHAKKSQWWMQGFASNAWQVRQVEKPRSRAQQFSNFWTFAAFLSAIRELDKEEKEGHQCSTLVSNNRIFFTKAKSKLGLRLCLTGHFIVSFAFSHFAI